MPQLVFGICQNPREVGSNASEEWMDLPVRARASRQRESFHLPLPLYRLPIEGVDQIKGGSSYLRSSGLVVYCPTSNDFIRKKVAPRCALLLGFLLIPDIVRWQQREPSHLPHFVTPLFCPHNYQNASIQNHLGPFTSCCFVCCFCALCDRVHAPMYTRCVLDFVLYVPSRCLGFPQIWETYFLVILYHLCC